MEPAYLAAEAISSRMAVAEAAGSGAWVMGRPTTRKLAPAAMAEAGVATRFWSPTAAPAGRMPGMTRVASGNEARVEVISSALQTKPRMPEFQAVEASRATWVAGASGTPTALSWAASMLVRTVTASS